MPSNKPQIKTYTEQWIKDKLNFIAKQECRTDSKQLEYIAIKYIADYESTNGEILINEDGTMELARPVLKGKSSNSQVG